MVAGGRLHADEGPVSELGDVARTRVREGALHAGHVVEDELTDRLLARSDVDPATGDALAVEPLDVGLEGVIALRATLHRGVAGHAVVGLVRLVVLVELDLGRRLVRPGEGGTEHHARSASRQVERDVAGVLDATIGPDMATELLRSPGAVVDRREARATHAGLHARGAHGAGPHVDLGDVGARLEEEGGRVVGAHVASHDRDEHLQLGQGVAHATDRVRHVALRTVSGVHHQHIDAGTDEHLDALFDVAVEADGSAHDQLTALVEARAPESLVHEEVLGDRTLERTVLVDDRQGVETVGLEDPEQLLGAVGEIASHGVVPHDGAHLGRGAGVADVIGRHDADDLAVGVDDTHHACLPLGEETAHEVHLVIDGNGNGRVEADAGGLDLADDVGRIDGRVVLGQDGDAAVAGHDLGHAAARSRVHVRDDERVRPAIEVVRGEVDGAARTDIRHLLHEEHVLERKLALVVFRVQETRHLNSPKRA